MINMLYGVLGMLLVMALLTGGFLLGWACRGKKSTAASAQPSREEQQKLEAEQRAFAELLSYDAQTAYGAVGGVESLGRDEV